MTDNYSSGRPDTFDDVRKVLVQHICWNYDFTGTLTQKLGAAYTRVWPVVEMLWCLPLTWTVIVSCRSA